MGSELFHPNQPMEHSIARSLRTRLARNRIVRFQAVSLALYLLLIEAIGLPRHEERFGAGELPFFAAVGVLAVLLLWSGKRWVAARSLVDYGLRLDRRSALLLGVGVLLGIGMQAWVTGGMWVLGVLRFVQVFRAPLGSAPLPEISVSVAAMLGGALFEEVVFRAHPLKTVVDTWVRGTSGRAVYVVIAGSALWFAMFHPTEGLWSLAVTFWMGVVFGCLYYHTGELALPLGAHVGVNLTIAHIMGYSNPHRVLLVFLEPTFSISVRGWAEVVGLAVLALVWFATPVVVAGGYLRWLARPGFETPLLGWQSDQGRDVAVTAANSPQTTGGG
jgi:membrane protease YdiL (CAAX protease family)